MIQSDCIESWSGWLANHAASRHHGWMPGDPYKREAETAGRIFLAGCGNPPKRQFKLKRLMRSVASRVVVDGRSEGVGAVDALILERRHGRRAGRRRAAA